MEHRLVLTQALDAHKGELYAALFASADGSWSRLRPDAVVTGEELLAWLPVSCAVVGDAVVNYGSFLREKLGRAIPLLPLETPGPRGGVVAALGWEYLQAGQSADPTDLEPCYIQPSYAVSMST